MTTFQDSLYLPRRYVDPWRRKHRGARRRRRGLSGCTRHLPRGVWTLAWHTHHLAARFASDRGQSASSHGV